jgi:hypothetical protein
MEIRAPARSGCAHDMPRGRCHFALLSCLHDRLRAELPDAAELADSHLPDFVAGSAAPDGLRYMAQLGKFATHFYTEDRRDTWGRAVSGLFRAHPSLNDPGSLSGRDRALLMGYISHLSVDEAFRDAVTSQLHGSEGWRPIVRGLWSIVDELPVRYGDLVGEVDRFSRTGRAGFIDREILGQYLDRIRAWAAESDPWSIERLFLELTRSDLSDSDARREWDSNRAAARAYLDEDRKRQFIDLATDLGVRDIGRFLAGYYKEG